jgi:tubulin-specific chaperone D
MRRWWAGCLALAELARRGILLPERLEQAVGIVHKALVFDVRRGTTSIGAHVRDAAAYVCWAFARAYAPAEMAVYVPVLARSLLVAALYDREINCRRAAAAAFQENVGRQGNYPHGIDIVTRADYFALGNRSNAFLVVAPFVASFPEYQEALANHLVTRQLRHWDLAMRDLSATALRKLVPLFPHFFVATALPSLLDAALSTDVPTRHGGACSIAQILLGLKDCGHKLPSDLVTRVVGLVPAVEKARLFRGRGGEAMRGACCRVIEAIALASILKSPPYLVGFILYI